MLPVRSTLGAEVETARLGDATYGMDMAALAVRGRAEGLRAVRQAVYKVLLTERYAYVIYSRNYGVELADLFGEPMSYVIPEAKRRITEALAQDERVARVDGFSVEERRSGVLYMRFNVHTVYGVFAAEREVVYA